MSSDPIGGYILSPLPRADLIAATLKTMELALDGFEVLLPRNGSSLLPEEGYPFHTERPPERALTMLAQEVSGVIEGSGGAEIFWFEPALASYQPITVWVEPVSMYYEKTPESVDRFARQWLQLCEQGQAAFGYFSPFFFLFEREYLQGNVLPAFQQGTAREFLGQITPGWLIYLGSELAERWRQEGRPSYSPLLVSQDLPSGAHFFRTSLGVSASSLSTLRP